jgi:hypothetical protein
VAAWVERSRFEQGKGAVNEREVPSLELSKGTGCRYNVEVDETTANRVGSKLVGDWGGEGVEAGAVYR